MNSLEKIGITLLIGYSGVLCHVVGPVVSAEQEAVAQIDMALQIVERSLQELSQGSYSCIQWQEARDDALYKIVSITQQDLMALCTSCSSDSSVTNECYQLLQHLIDEGREETGKINSKSVEQMRQELWEFDQIFQEQQKER